MKSAQWIISEAGLQSLVSAGITTGWLKAWVLSAGATDVSLHLLTSDSWCNSTVGWQIFYATEDELKGIPEPAHDRKVLRLLVGDVAYRRHDWLALLNRAKPLSPLYVCADDTLPLKLETGLSASLVKPTTNQYLNDNGLLIEEQVIATLKQHQLFMRTVESCTAGGIAARLCRIPGASDVVDKAWVTYSNAAKQEEVGVAADVLEGCGAVSQEAVIAMAEGGATAAHICVAVTGIAGPSGGTKDKPVGTVWIAVALKGQDTISQCLQFTGVRHEVQARTIIASLCLLLKAVDKSHFF